MPTIVIAGALANKPNNGGNAWAVLSWAMGFRALGFEVAFVEQIASDRCSDAEGRPCPFWDSEQLAYFCRSTEAAGLAGRVTLRCEGDDSTFGMMEADLDDLARSADALVNITGHWTLRPPFDRIARKIYLDLDPGYTQFWQAEGNPGTRMEGHDHFYTVGENIGRPGCSIPPGDIPWMPTRQPATLGDWPASRSGEFDRFTTVASWRGSYGPAQHGGRTFGQKAHEFRKFFDLPRLTGRRFEVALDIHPADGKDREALARRGWEVVDPVEAAGDLESFRRYVGSSGAEFSAAQGVYVSTCSGWSSDRTVRYLASGRPALVQDTGLGRNLPVGEGLIAFTTLEDAAEGAARIVRDYAGHCQAARALAESHFESSRVIGKLCHEVGLDGLRARSRSAGR